jgi:hypothetical protein
VTRRHLLVGLLASILGASCVSRRTHSTLLMKMERSENALSSARSSESRLRKENERLQTEMASAIGRIAAYQADADAALRADYGNLERSFASLKDQASKLYEQCKAIQTGASQCNASVESLRVQVATLATNQCAPAPRYAPSAPLAPYPTDGRWFAVEASANDEVFVINGEVYKAQTYCFNLLEGDHVLFVEGSEYGACASAELLVRRTGQICKVWCE